MSQDINQMVIRTALRAMFNKGYVDITAIKECLKLANITSIGPVMGQLQALHCVHFKDMDRPLAEEIPSMVAGLFDGVELQVNDLFEKKDRLDDQIIDVTPAPKGRSFLRLIGMK